LRLKLFDEAGQLFLGDALQIEAGDFFLLRDDGAETSGDFFLDGAGGNIVFFVIGLLNFAAAVGLGDGFFHAFGDVVGVHDDFAVDVAGGAADGLDEGGFRAKEAFFVGVKNSDEGDFGEVETFAEEVDADENVVDSGAEVAEDVAALEGIDVGVDISDFDIALLEVVGEVFGHFLGQSRDEGALILRDASVDFFHEIVNLAFGGADFDFGVEEAGRADDLLGRLRGVLKLVRARGGRDVNCVFNMLLKLGENQGAVVEGRG
jgi:hypothetical protein